MTTEELLRPRYKVIADWPGNRMPVGVILMSTTHDCFIWDGLIYHKSMLEHHPHLFKKLEWWEERKPEDMPEYYKIDGAIYKWGREHGLDCCIARGRVLPSTESEYNTYINQVTPNNTAAE